MACISRLGFFNFFLAPRSLRLSLVGSTVRRYFQFEVEASSACPMSHSRTREWLEGLEGPKREHALSFCSSPAGAGGASNIR